MSGLVHAENPVWRAQSDGGLYTVILRSETAPVPIRKFHNWLVELYDAQGNPVPAARLAIDGGMPDHGHGLPSRPKLKATGSPGIYLIEGMKFNMGGAWRLELSVIQPQVDKAVFEIQLSY